MNEMIEKKLEGIELPDGLHEACLQGIARGRRSRRRSYIVRFAVVAAAVCVLALPGLAKLVSGHIEDIYEGTAIVGQVYVEADNDITVTAGADDGGETVRLRAVFVNPEEAPFAYIDELTVHIEGVSDGAGNNVTGPLSARSPITDGVAEFELQPGVPVENGYTLTIAGFTGKAKAEQPLEIQGTWQCEIVIQ